MRLTLNGEPVETEVETLGDLLGDRLGGLPPSGAVAVNREVVPRAQVYSRPLAEGDDVEVVTAVAGG